MMVMTGNVQGKRSWSFTFILIVCLLKSALGDIELSLVFYFRWSRGEKVKEAEDLGKGDAKEKKDKDRSRPKQTEKDLLEKLKSADSLSGRFQSRGEFSVFER